MNDHKHPWWHFFQTLQAKFLLALILVGILPLGLVGVSIAKLDSENLADQSASELRGLARGLANQLQTMLEDMLMDMQALASLPEIISMDPTAQTRLLQQLYLQKPKFSRFYIFDLDGKLQASSHANETVEMGEMPLFQQTATQGTQVWSIVAYPDDTTRELWIYTPIRNAQQEMVGVIAGKVDLKDIVTVLERVQVGGKGRAFVLDAENRVLLHPDPAQMQKREDFSDLAVWNISPLVGTGSVKYGTAGNRRIAGFAPVPTFNWTVLVERPEAMVLEPARRSWQLATMGLTVSAVIALLAAIWLAQALTRPLRELVVVARAFAAGNPAVPLPTLPNDEGELSTLINAFAEMRKAVLEREEGLRRSEARNRAIVNAIPDMMLRIRKEEGDLSLQLAGEGTPDILPELSLGERIRTILPGDIREVASEHIDRALDNDETQIFEYSVSNNGCQLDFEARIAVSGENEILAIFRDITERKRTEAQLQTSLAEKEIMLKEIHHRVKNNLQVISSLLKLQAGHISDRRSRSILSESQNRIRSIALIHERLYRSADLAQVDFTEYTQDLVTHLFRSYGVDPHQIGYEIAIRDVHLDINTAIPCGLIISELISNSLKHAFPDNQKGRICIQMAPENDTYSLTVSDTGVGLPTDMDIGQTETLGLQLLVTLTKQIGGTFTVETNAGTTFKIVFPVT